MRELPKLIEAEETVIGTLLFHSTKNEVFSVFKEIVPRDFYASSNRLIYDTMLALLKMDLPLDPIMIVKHLTDEGLMSDAVQDALFRSMDRAVPVPSLPHWVGVVKGLSQRRSLIMAYDGAANGLCDTTVPLETILSEVTGASLDATNRTAKSQLMDSEQCMQSCLETIMERQETRTSAGVDTGFPEFNASFGGLIPGELIISAGRPGMGKTALALDIGLHVAQKRDVYIFSLEMTQTELMERTVCKQTKIPQQALRGGYLSDRQIASITDASGDITDLKLYIDDDPMVTPGQIYAKVLGHSTHYKTNPALVIVDYIGLVTPDTPGHSREQEIATISRAFKQQAKLLNCTYLIVCQLNREAERRENREPRLSDLRESGAIEQDANVVLGLFRKFYYTNREEDSKKALCAVLKNRSGSCPKIDLLWEPETATFKSIPNRTEEPIDHTPATSCGQPEDTDTGGEHSSSDGSRPGSYHGKYSESGKSCGLFD